MLRTHYVHLKEMWANPYTTTDDRVLMRTLIEQHRFPSALRWDQIDAEYGAAVQVRRARNVTLFRQPAAAPLTRMMPSRASPGRQCKNGQPCGNSCISWRYTCHK